MNNIPKVTVLLSVYNGEKYLKEAIDSILTQAFKDFEFLIINDASTDTSRDIILSCDDSRIRLVDNEENIGLTKSLNKGISIARGEYIARQDADDVSLSDRLQEQVEYMDRNPDVGLLSSNMEFIDDKSVVTGRSNKICDSDLVAWLLLFLNYVGGHSQVMYKRKLVAEMGGYSEEYRVCEDYELWLRMSEKCRIAIIDNIHIQYRKHSSNISVHHFDEQESNAYKAKKVAISRVLGIDFNDEELVDLCHLWKAEVIPENHIQGAERNLKRIYKKFIARRKKKGLSKKIRYRISVQYFKLHYETKCDNNIITNIRILYYSFRWSPNNFIKQLFSKLLRVIKLKK